MFDQPATPGEPAPPALANDVATAPGDLPTREVIARAALQAEQFRHDNTIAPLAARAGEPVVVEATSGELMRLERAAVFYTTGGRVPGPGDPAVAMERAEVDWNVHAGFVTRWRAVLPPQPAGTFVRYRIGGWRSAQAPGGEEPDLWAHDGQGFWFRVPGPAGITTFAYIAEEQRPALPTWATDAVVYHIFVDRFHPGTRDGRFRPAGYQELHGGTLGGVRAALPYLSDLGVTCLFLSPIFEAPSYHRYDAVDLFRVDPRVGGDDELRLLVREARDRGMRIVLDYVPSHASSKHPAFLAAQQDQDAESFPWFTFYEWPHSYRNFLDVVPSLPSFNTEDPGARRHLVDAAVHWMREFGVAGYRIDHAIGPSMDFWVQLRQETGAVTPDAFLFGEVTDTPDSLRRYAGRLHGILDFPLARALRHTFALGDWDVARFAAYLDAYEQYMAGGPGRVSFLDNHDMDRFLFMARDDTTRLKLAALAQFTLDATPIVYYGTEVGMTQEAGFKAAGYGGDAQARHDMPWDSSRWDQDLLGFYRRLIRLRHDNPVLRRGRRRTLLADPRAATLAYARVADAGAAPADGDLLVVFNLGQEPRAMRLPGAHRAPAVVFQTSAQPPTLHGEGEALTVTLPGRTGAVLRAGAG